MNILAIESASTVCGVALFINDDLRELDEIIAPRKHGERLPVVIERVLRNNNINVNDLDGVAISEGPGSYTGLRIGINLAKGLAAAVSIPIIPIPTLQVINATLSIKELYWIVLHSHKNIVYAQRFKSGKQDSKIECSEFDKRRFVNPIGFNLDEISDSIKYKSVAPSSEYVGKLAIQHFESWSKLDLNNIVPNYVNNIQLVKN